MINVNSPTKFCFQFLMTSNGEKTWFLIWLVFLWNHEHHLELFHCIFTLTFKPQKHHCCDIADVNASIMYRLIIQGKVTVKSDLLLTKHDTEVFWCMRTGWWSRLWQNLVALKFTTMNELMRDQRDWLCCYIDDDCISMRMFSNLATDKEHLVYECFVDLDCDIGWSINVDNVYITMYGWLYWKTG